MTVVVPAAQPTPRLWRGGRTWEIGRDPADADYPDGDYRLWVGRATIERSADYSHFAAAERLHVLLAGDGLRLHFRQPDATVELATRQACAFSGERPLHAELLGATVTAFNLVYRAGMTSGAGFVRLDGRPAAHTVTVAAGTTHTQIVHAVTGRAVLERSGGEHRLGEGDTALWNVSGPATERFVVRSDDGPAELLVAFVCDPPAPATAAR
ncbi:MAG TPA: HutD family protein [Ilumatobacter sp.]